MGTALHLNGDASCAVGKWKLALMYLSSPGKACDGSEQSCGSGHCLCCPLKSVSQELLTDWFLF